MEEVGPNQDQQSEHWKRVDARILGQVLAAQNLLFVLPDEARIAQFFSEALGKVPGVSACVVCLGRLPAPASVGGQVCAKCSALPGIQEETVALPYEFSCELSLREGLRSIRVGTYEHTFGFFIFQTDMSDLAEPYWPFLKNLANYVGLSLENRMQKLLLEKARDELEDRVKNRTEELKQMNERFSLAVRAASLGVWDWDVLKDELIWDDRMYELYGVKREVFSGAYETWLKGVHPEDRAASEEILNQARRGERPYNTEFRVVWPDNSIHYLKAYGQFVRDENGTPLRMTGINYDISDLKQAEEDLRQLNQELEQRVTERTAQLEATNKELEAFAYTVSHDLRAPLRHIDSFLELLQRRLAGALDERSRHYIVTIAESARRMGELIDDLLSFSRMARSELAKRPVDLGALVREIVGEFEPELRGRSISWRIAALPIVTGDKAMLRLVLVNFLANALKFTRTCQSAEIEVGCRIDEKETVVFIHDNGVGFDMTYVDKLFGVFQRLHRADEFEGSGIGLATVRRIIQRHGGRVWAEGQINQGATFYFSLPHIEET